MKIKLIYIMSIILFIGCKKEDTLTFEPYTISNKNCDTCSLVTIDIPKALDRTQIGETINVSLREEIISLLNFDEDSDIQNVEGAINAFDANYKELIEKFPEESMPWEAKVNGAITYENKDIITIKLESYLFTGGAHGYSTMRFLNFNKAQGTELEQQELFKNMEDFKSYAETQFRKQENIPAETSINSTGFMFETENFNLSENIGYTDKGLLLFYEPYEITSYADGPITLYIPYNQVNSFLRFPIQS